MKKHLLAWVLCGSIYLPVAACGDDDTPATPAGEADASGDSTTADTSTSDSSNADTSATDGPVADAVVDVITDAGADRPDLTGQGCTAPSQCYATLDAAALSGPAACLPVEGGYCTHECTQDSDCCSTPGECKTSLKQVCASFTSSGTKYCFLSCEAADLTDAGIDAGAGQTFCESQSADFGCRSTGGGVNNRKVCLPGGGGLTDGGSDASDASADAPTD